MTAYYASLDLDALATAYAGRVVNPAEITITREAADPIWQPVAQQQVTIELDNADGALTAVYTSRPTGGQAVTVKRYDWLAGASLTKFAGIVTQPRLASRTLRLESAVIDRAVFQQQLPTGVVDTATWPLAVDAGATKQVLFGVVPRVPLLYVHDDTGTSTFDYLVGHGRCTITGLYRNGPNDTLYAIDPGECTRTAGGAATSWAEVARFDYPGYTNVRLTLRQTDFNNAFYRLYADIIAPGRNPARLARRVLVNAVWGLAQTVDTTTCAVAEAQIAALGASHRSAVLSMSPTAYYRLDEASGTQAADSSGNARHASYQGTVGYHAPSAPIGGDDQGYAVQLNGNVANYVQVDATTAAAFNHATAGSVSAWYTPVALADQAGLYEKTIGGAVNTSSLLFQNTDPVNAITWRVVQSTVLYDCVMPLAADDIGMSHHFVGTYNNGGLRLYMDGALVAIGAYPAGAIDTGTGVAVIGRLGTLTGTPIFPCSGALDEVAVWAGVALSATQVQTLYASGGLLADGALVEPRRAQDVLASLLAMRGMRPVASATGAIGLQVDVPSNTVAAVLGDDVGDGPRNRVASGERAYPAPEDRVQGLVLQYAWDYVHERFVQQSTRSVNTTGQSKPIDGLLIRDHTTADRVCDYLAKKHRYGQETIEVTITQEGRALEVGDLVSFTKASQGFSGEIMEVIRIAERLTTLTLTLARRSWATYLYEPGTLPADATAGTASDYTRTAPTAASTPTLSTSGTRTAGDNHLTAWVTLAFTNPSSNLSAARVRYRVNGTTLWIVGTVTAVTGSTTATLEGLLPNVAYDFSIQTVNLPGNLTTDSGNLLNQTVANPSIATPSAGPIVSSPKPGQFVIIDQATRGVNVKGMRVFRNTANSMSSPTPTDLGEIGGTVWIDNTGAYATQYWFAVKHVDGGKNLSAFSATGTSGAGGAAKVATGDVGSGQITGTEIATGASGVATGNIVGGAVTGEPAYISTTPNYDLTTSYADITNLTRTLTISSASSPVLIVWSGQFAFTNTTGVPLQITVDIQLLQGSTVICHRREIRDIVNGQQEQFVMAMNFIDVGASGSTTYKLQGKYAAGSPIAIGTTDTHDFAVVELKR